MCGLEASSSGLSASSVYLPEYVPKCCSLAVMGTYLTLRNRVLNLIHLDLTEPLDLRQITARSRMHRGNRVVSVGLQFSNVDRADTMGLNRVDINDESILMRSEGSDSPEP